jgi:hypothetical protein
MPTTAACASKQSAVSHETYGLFGAADGIYLVNEGGCKRITGDHYDRKTWNELYPTTLHGVIHDGKYWAWYSYGGTQGGIVLDLATGELTTLDFYTDAAFADPQTDKLYFVVEDEGTNYVYEWEGDITQPLGTYTWKSKEFLLPRSKTFRCGRIIFDGTDRSDYYALLQARRETIQRNNTRISNGTIHGVIGEDPIGYPVAINEDELETVPNEPTYTGDDQLQLKVYVDGTLEFTKEVYITRPFRLGSGYRGGRWELEIIGNVNVEWLGIADSMKELKSISEEE